MILDTVQRGTFENSAAGTNFSYENFACWHEQQLVMELEAELGCAYWLLGTVQ
jgi:hypothetical protein